VLIFSVDGKKVKCLTKQSFFC